MEAIRNETAVTIECPRELLEQFAAARASAGSRPDYHLACRSERCIWASDCGHASPSSRLHVSRPWPPREDQAAFQTQARTTQVLCASTDMRDTSGQGHAW